VGSENLNPLAELKGLDQQVDKVTELAGLKPIFFRLDEIAKQHPHDFQIQLVVGDIKQHLVNRGTRIKEMQQTATQQPPTPATPQPPVESAPPAPPAAAPPPPPPPAKPQPVASAPPSAEKKPAPPPPAPKAPPPAPPPAAVSKEPPSPVPPPAPATQPTAKVPPAAKVPPRQPPPQPPRSPLNWKRALLLGALAGSILSILMIAFLVNQARKRNLSNQAAAGVPVQIATTPPGASVRINGEAKCTSDCTLPLPPGNYQITAFLDGYEPAASGITVAAGRPGSVSLAFEPQAQALRILTDLDQGKVTIDDRPAADLQEGQFILDKVEPGPHTVKLAGRNSDASFAFEIAAGKPPAITGTVNARNLIAVLVSSFGSQARVVTNSGPMKLALNGQPQGDAGPAGLDLKDFQPGVDELVVGEGKDERNMKESFGPVPMITAFFKSDLNIGTLIVSTGGEDGVRVFLNDKEYRQRTQRGQVRIQTIGKAAVRIAKDGYQNEPVQTAEIKKGAEVRLEFKLRPLPQEAMLQIRGATPASEVLIDQKTVGTVANDGYFAYNTVAPGDHTIELRREQYTPKRLQRAFRAGQTVEISGSEVVLAAIPVVVPNATVKVNHTPAEAALSYRRNEETQTHDLRGNQVDLPPGIYVFTGTAPGYLEHSVRFTIGPGETRTIEIALQRDRPAVAATAAPKTGDMTDFEDPGSWRKEGDLWVHKGGGFIPYKMAAKGIFTFTVTLVHGGNLFRGGRIRWALQYADPKNYDLYEMDKKTLWSKVVANGKTLERAKMSHDLEKEKSYTVQIEVTPERLIHKVRSNGNWVTLDTWSEPGRNFTEGKFGFLIQGNDEIGVSDFKFEPK
jgi:outer membrane biosynthesis protein TonB